ncbi:MAG: ATP-dependent Clp protease adaptor ClpS [Helicobacteraceae bacterium]|nr:ATP-dependent Clp protease adaptor ClpS [Helicobacteraceae bacterium]
MGTQLDSSHESEVVFSKPPRFSVLLLNDDYTSMEFVIKVLMNIFRKNAEDAHQIMLDVHKNGSGNCGTYSYDIARTKIAQVEKSALDEGFPLKAIMKEL